MDDVRVGNALRVVRDPQSGFARSTWPAARRRQTPARRVDWSGEPPAVRRSTGPARRRRRHSACASDVRLLWQGADLDRVMNDGARDPARACWREQPDCSRRMDMAAGGDVLALRRAGRHRHPGLARRDTKPAHHRAQDRAGRPAGAGRHHASPRAPRPADRASARLVASDRQRVGRRHAIRAPSTGESRDTSGLLRAAFPADGHAMRSWLRAGRRAASRHSRSGQMSARRRKACSWTGQAGPRQARSASQRHGCPSVQPRRRGLQTAEARPSAGG